MLNEKYEILEHHHNFLYFLQSLKKLNENLLRKPISEGKWSVIEIISHFRFWDEFIVQNRTPYFLTNSSLPPSPNADDLNFHDSLQARHDTIQHTFKKCIRVRRELMKTLNELPEEKWLAELNINQSTLTLYTYFKGLMEHDIHHLNQIQSFIKNENRTKNTETL